MQEIKQEKTEQTEVYVSDKKVLAHTVFGLSRITLYLAVPAFLGVYIEKHFFPDPSNAVKLTILFSGLIIGWGLIILDYVFIMKKTSVTHKNDSAQTKK